MRNLKGAGCLCALLAGLSRTAAAEGTNGTEMTLPTLVVTPTREARRVEDVPYAAGLLDAETLRVALSARTVPEALAYEPGIMVQKTAHGQGSPYIRGFTSQRTLFLVDGVRLNNAVFREGPNPYWNTVDPLSLHAVEIVRGPASVLYGSDAVGGTVRAVTRGRQDALPDQDWTRRIYYRFAGAEDAHTARLETIGRLGDALTLTAGYSWKDFGDLEGGGEVGTQEKTGYDERDWDAKLEYDPGGGGRLVLAHQNVELDDAWRTHKTIYGIGWEGLTVGDELRRVLDQERELTYVQYRREARGGPVETLEAGVSYQRQAEDRERVRTRDRYDVQGFEDGTLGAFMHARSPSALGSLVYGVEYYRDDVDSFQRNLNPDGSVKSTAIQGPVGDAAAYDLLGVYLQDELRPAERVSVLVGGRYEFARADADAVEDPATGDRMSVSGDWDDVVGSARMLYALDAARTWTLFAGVSQGFRAPNLSDLTRLDTARTDEIETPSPGLDPEHFTAYEAGLKAAAADLSAQVAYYYTDIDGMIVRTPTGNEIDGNREVTKQNGGDGYVQGFEADGRWRVGAGVTAFGAFTWMYGEVETFPTSDPVLVTEYMDRLMPPTGRLGVRWARARRYWIEAACTMAGKADKLSTRDAADTSRIPPGGTPGYVVYDVRAGWKPLPDLALSLAVENVTDADYRIHGSGVNEPGRNVVLTADWVF